MGELALKQQLQEKGLLDQFSEDAIKFAESVNYPTVVIEGETWAVATEVARAKGVAPSDFRDNTGLKKASPEKQAKLPEAIKSVLSIPGTRAAYVPTAFSVKGGYAISCGGDGAKTGINALIKEQRPDWRPQAQYTLLNLPLQLSYLMHGRTVEAKATRDLTIGTTIKVAKAAAEQETAPMAVHQLAGSPEANALLLKLMEVMSAETRTAQLTAERAELKADHADEKAEKALQLGLTLSQQVLAGKKKRPDISPKTRNKLRKMWEQYFYGECPCCHKPVTGEQGTLEIDHFWNQTNELENLWLICKQCNHRMGKPGPHRNRQDQQRHSTWLDRCGLAVVQPDIFFGTLPPAA